MKKTKTDYENWKTENNVKTIAEVEGPNGSRLVFYSVKGHLYIEQIFGDSDHQVGIEFFTSITGNTWDRVIHQLDEYVI